MDGGVTVRNSPPTRAARACGIFFATLKRELDGLDGRLSTTEVRQSVFMYIETYYNQEQEAEDNQLEQRFSDR